MNILLWFLPLAVVTLAVFVAIIARARARAYADQVIYDKRPTNATEINKRIATIRTVNTFLPYHTYQDIRRLRQLRNIRNALILK
jgi:hypothetical protein